MLYVVTVKTRAGDTVRLVTAANTQAGANKNALAFFNTTHLASIQVESFEQVFYADYKGTAVLGGKI